MAGLVTVEELREIFEIHEDIKGPRVQRHITAAGRRLRGWVGDEAYDDAASGDPEDEDRKEDLQLAEAHLAMSIAILGLNTSLRPTGVVKTERVEGQVTLSYHGPDEVAKLQQLFLEQAETIARPYLVVTGSDELNFGVLTDACDSGEATTRPCGCPAPCV